VHSLSVLLLPFLFPSFPAVRLPWPRRLCSLPFALCRSGSFSAAGPKKDSAAQGSAEREREREGEEGRVRGVCVSSRCVANGRAAVLRAEGGRRPAAVLSALPVSRAEPRQPGKAQGNRHETRKQGGQGRRVRLSVVRGPLGQPNSPLRRYCGFERSAQAEDSAAAQLRAAARASVFRVTIDRR